MDGSKKNYHLIERDDYFYCVPTRDITSAAIQCLDVEDEVSFKYGKLSGLTGTIKYISRKEKEVMSRIKDLKRERKKGKEGSFHADKPRDAALKQRKLMESMKPAASGSKPALSEKKAEKKKQKAMQGKKKAAAEARTESLMTLAAIQEQLAEVKNLKADANSNSESDSDLDVRRNSSSSSASSLDVKCKGTGTKSEDIQVIKTLVFPALSELEDSPSATKDGVIVNGADSSENTASSPPDESLNSKTTAMKRKCHIDDTDEVKSKEMKMSSSEEKNIEEEVPHVDKEKVDNHDAKTADANNSKKDRAASDEGGTDLDENNGDGALSTGETATSSGEEKRKQKDKKKKKKKKVKKHKKRKHAKKGKRRARKYSTSSSSSSESSSSSSSSSSEDEKASRKIKRNFDVYPGPNFLYSKNDPGVVKLVDDKEVYVKQSELSGSFEDAKSPQMWITNIVPKVFTLEALKGSTAQGYPARGRGTKNLKQKHVLPRIHPDGRDAIIRRATQLENERKSWRPRVGKAVVSAAFAAAISMHH